MAFDTSFKPFYVSQKMAFKSDSNFILLGLAWEGRKADRAVSKKFVLISSDAMHGSAACARDGLSKRVNGPQK